MCFLWQNYVPSVYIALAAVWDNTFSVLWLVAWKARVLRSSQISYNPAKISRVRIMLLACDGCSDISANAAASVKACSLPFRLPRQQYVW